MIRFNHQSLNIADASLSVDIMNPDHELVVCYLQLFLFLSCIDSKLNSKFGFVKKK